MICPYCSSEQHSGIACNICNVKLEPDVAPRFCPKCRNQQHNDAFCSRCGTQMPLDNAFQLKYVCPYCGNEHAGGPWCRHCGADLLTLFVPLSKPDPPLGRYKGNTGYLEICRDFIVFHDPFLSGEAKHMVVPYHEIQTVSYQKGGWIVNGFLSLRQLDGTPAQKLYAASQDGTSICFTMTKNDIFGRLYAYLQTWVKQNRLYRFLTKTPEG